jgi:threonine aldolase
MSINFRSDNEAPVAPEILDAIAAVNKGFVHSYGEDQLTADLEQKFSEIFATDVQVWPLATGTAANSLAMAQICEPFGSIYCHAHAHMNTDECGAPEFFTAGAKLVGLDGDHGKLDATELGATLDKTGYLDVHEVMPSALSLSQATEFGTVYTPDEVGSLSEVARSHDLKVHMDGARFANAVQSLGVAPADITWKAGVDLMSFGATKNGAMMAEALLVFDSSLAEQLGRRRKRAGHLLSKMRYVSAQLDACLSDNRWLKWAANANQQAEKLSTGLTALSGIELLHPVQANEVFVRMDEKISTGLYAAGFQFHVWPGTQDIYRLVCTWCSTDEDVDALLGEASQLASAI